MNKERLEILADWLERGAPHKHVKFNMNECIRLRFPEGSHPTGPKDACGSVCCIAGAATQFFTPEVALSMALERWKDGGMTAGMRIAGMMIAGMRALDLDKDRAWKLFAPSLVRTEYDDITPQQAGKVVRHMLETGKVDWSVAGVR